MKELPITRSRGIFDVAIAGGGPAGVMCACALVAQGYSVVVLDAGTPVERIEGLSPRLVQLLVHKGMQSALQAVSARLPRTVEWGTWQDVASPDQQGSSEHLVMRPRFDHLLREIARERGATVLTQRVHSITRLPDGQVELVTDAGRVQARFAVDARGRRANRIASGWSAPRNLALAAFVQGIAAETGSSIRTLAQGGWLWMARRGQDEPVWAQLLLEAHTDNPAGIPPAEYFETVLMAELQCERTQIGTPLIRGADFRLNTRWALEDGCLPIGDACAAFDPLSGHGLFWACSSALSAAAIVHTLLQDKRFDRRALCERFYRQRMADTFWRQTRVGRDFYALSGQDGLFWSLRAQWPDAVPLNQPAVDRPAISREPAIQDGQVIESDVLRVPGEHGALAWFDAIPLVAVLRVYAKQVCSGEEPGSATFCRVCSPHAGQTVALRCWHWLQQHHLLDDLTLFESGDRGDYVETIKPISHGIGRSAGDGAARHRFGQPPIAGEQLRGLP